MSCPDEPHVHHDITVAGIIQGHQISMDGRGIALVVDRNIADHIATLLTRHGLADIPENAAEIAPPPHLDTADRTTTQHARVDPTTTSRPNEEQ